MRIKYVFLVLIFLISNKAFTQNALPPAYLLKQDFPDSVLNLSLLKLDGSKSNFASILESYKGRKIVVDFWASWCRDCINGLPKIKNLRAKTREDKVVYLFISVDKDEAKWRTAINRFNIKGEHFRIEIGWHNTLTNYINLDWIPRYLLLNEEGKVIISKAISADDEALNQSLME